MTVREHAALGYTPVRLAEAFSSGELRPEDVAFSTDFFSTTVSGQLDDWVEKSILQRIDGDASQAFRDPRD